MADPLRAAADLGRDRLVTNTVTRWRLSDTDDAGVRYDGEQARRLIGSRFAWANAETWFAADDGRRLGVVTNGARAMVILMNGDNDPGEHLAAYGAEGESGGYILANGQCDTYADRDTVPLDTAGRAIAHLIDHGTWPDDVGIIDDRGDPT